MMTNYDEKSHSFIRLSMHNGGTSRNQRCYILFYSTAYTMCCLEICMGMNMHIYLNKRIRSCNTYFQIMITHNILIGF